MKSLFLDLNDLSQFRTQLMGIAAVMIICCHAPASGVLMPYSFHVVLNLGNFGVDIFLLLSGLGLWFSLNKKPVNTVRGGVIYCKKRFYRLFVSYLVIYIPYCAILFALGEYSFVDCLLSLSTLEYWLFHRGAWFVSLIVVLYLLSPFLYKVFNTKLKWLYVVGLIVVIVCMCNYCNSDSDIVHNVLFALGRVPCFLVGMAIGSEIQAKKKLPLVWIVVLSVVFIVAGKALSIVEATSWLILPLIMYLLVLIVRMLNRVIWLDKSLCFLGRVSLESYLTNITLNKLLLTLIPAYITSSLFYGRWIEYIIVIIVGLLLAYLVNKISSLLQVKLS